MRGICCLRPGVKGVSDHIRVRSIVGRFLEHSRAFFFLNGGAEDLYLGSADWMQRNLTRRVEVVFPVEDRAVKKKVLQVLELCLQDNDKARELYADGSYRYIKRKAGQHRINSQEKLLDISARRAARISSRR